MGMEAISMELKVMSCRDLKAFNFFHKLSAYVVVSIFDDDTQKNQKQKLLQRQKTPIDKDGGGNPEWNHMMHFDLKGISLLDPSPNLFVKFFLRCEGIIYGNKTIGEVCVPFKDLIDESTGDVRFVSYQVRTTDGKPNGVLNFSFKVTDNDNKTGTGSDPSSVDSSSGIDFPAEKVRYPSLEDTEKVRYPSLGDEYPSRDICYPTVDVQSPSPGISFPSQILYYQTPEFHRMTPPPPPPPPPVVPGALYYSPPPRPYEYGLCGYPAVGQVERFDGDSWRLRTSGDGFPALWTGR